MKRLTDRAFKSRMTRLKKKQKELEETIEILKKRINLLENEQYERENKV